MARRSVVRPDEISAGEEMDMTPMIDVTFLLIIFFLIVTELNDEAKRNLDLPDAVESREDIYEDGRLVINIMQEGTIFIQHLEYDHEQLARELELERRASTSRKDPLPGRAILLRVDQNTPWEHVYGVMHLCMQKQLWKIDRKSVV